jgi:hypothetical protein
MPLFLPCSHWHFLITLMHRGSLPSWDHRMETWPLLPTIYSFPPWSKRGVRISGTKEENGFVPADEAMDLLNSSGHLLGLNKYFWCIQSSICTGFGGACQNANT